MSKIAVIGAMETEIDYLRKRFGASTIAIPNVYTAQYGGHWLIIALCSIGKVNAAVCTQQLIDHLQVDMVINTGIAGALSKEMPLCSVVLGKEVVYHDFTPDWILKKNPPYANVFKADPRLLELAEKVCKTAADVPCYKAGKIATGDCFVEDAATAARLKEMGCDCVEMEGAAIAHTCLLNKIPCLIIRSLSDFADEAAMATMHEQEQLASRQAGVVVEGILKNL